MKRMAGVSAVVIISTWFASSASPQNGTASITGSVVGKSEAVIPGVQVELMLVPSPGAAYRGLSDGKGVYAFAGLAAGEYTLTLSTRWFSPLRLDGIVLGDGQHKTIPPLDMFLALSGCSDSLSLDHIRFLEGAGDTGEMAGTVKVDQDHMEGAEVRLYCGKKSACAIAKTDAMGQFEFRSLAPGNFSLAVSGRGFYPVERLDLEVQKGRRFVYRPVFVDRCPRGNCAPRLRPKKPFVVCE